MAPALYVQIAVLSPHNSMGLREFVRDSCAWEPKPHCNRSSLAVHRFVTGAQACGLVNAFSRHLQPTALVSQPSTRKGYLLDQAVARSPLRGRIHHADALRRGLQR